MSTQRLGGLDILARVVREYYDFAHVGIPEPMPNAHQRRHRKLVLKTDRGQFLVKTYKRDPYVLDALRFQHRLSDHLAENGIPVAKICPSKTGHRIVEIENWALELQEFVDGAPMLVSSGTLITSAEALGRFHEVCRDFPRPERDARMWRFSEVPRESLKNLYEQAMQEGDPGAATDYCNRIALFLRNAGEALSWEARGAFETGLIHGDWHAGNLIFKDDKLVAVVDLEFAGDGCFLEDLSYAISNLCVRTTIRDDRLAKRVDLLLHEYQQHRSLSFAETAALYYAVGVKHVATVSYQLSPNSPVVAGLNSFQWMTHLTFQLEWLERRAKSVRWG